jgi:hypothetical protein
MLDFQENVGYEENEEDLESMKYLLVGVIILPRTYSNTELLLP